MDPIEKVQAQYQQVRREIADAAIACGRDSEDVMCLAVSKTADVDAIHAVIQLGQKDFAENRVQVALPKIQALASMHLGDITWHFIGPIQSNKTEDIAKHFSWVHSVDRMKVAERLSAQRSPSLPPLNICVQVKVENDPERQGVAFADIIHFCDQLSPLTNIKLRGLMCMPAASASEEEIHQAFAKTKQMLETLNQKGYHLDTLSMGMSGDYQIAIQEGSTMVRVGTAIFK